MSYFSGTYKNSCTLYIAGTKRRASQGSYNSLETPNRTSISILNLSENINPRVSGTNTYNGTIYFTLIKLCNSIPVNFWNSTFVLNVSISSNVITSYY